MADAEDAHSGVDATAGEAAIHSTLEASSSKVRSVQWMTRMVKGSLSWQMDMETYFAQSMPTPWVPWAFCKCLICLSFIGARLLSGDHAPEIWGRKPNWVGDIPRPQAVTACIARILLISLGFLFWRGLARFPLSKVRPPPKGGRF